MYEDMATKMAKIMTEYSQPVNKGDFVVIQAGNGEATPLVQALYEAVLQRGGNPMALGGTPGLSERFFMLADEDQLNFLNPVVMAMVEHVNISFNIFAASNTKSLATVDPEKLAINQKAARPFIQRFEEREKAGDLRWCILPWPTNAEAQEGDMGLLAYTKFVYESCGFHLDDPIAYWKSMRDKQMKLVDYLQGKHEAVIKGPGIDMAFHFEERPWVSCHGTVNFPDGEIFTSPIEDSVNGTVEFNLRTMYGGREINGVRLEFKDGKVVDASAKKGEDYLFSQLDTDEGARRLGEFAIGTNWNIQEVTGSTLFDEKIGGTLHMALGRSIHTSKGANESVIHWDMVHDMKAGGEIHIDGNLFYNSGEFKI
jgi:aminopeptidase